MDEQNQGPDKGPKLKIWPKLLLVASLALNLLVLGAVVGTVVMHRDRDDGDRRRMRDVGLLPFVAALDETDRAALRSALATRTPEIGERHQAMRTSAEAILSTLRADPFDPVALAASLTKMRDTGRQAHFIGHTALTQRLQAMSAEERQAYADRLERRFDRGERRKKR